MSECEFWCQGNFSSHCKLDFSSCGQNRKHPEECLRWLLAKRAERAEKELAEARRLLGLVHGLVAGAIEHSCPSLRTRDVEDALHQPPEAPAPAQEAVASQGVILVGGELRHSPEEFPAPGPCKKEAEG